jgi:coiled-coil domain-containing protein 12
MFRNYRKDDEERKITDEINITEITEVPGVKEQLEEMQTPMEVTDIDISNLAPRKIDFDLKRAINKKLQKLEKRTQKAISELIRDRLKSQNENDFASNVNLGAQETQKASTQDVDSDD